MAGDPLDDLREEIRENRALYLIGSGVSVGATKNAPVASWPGLIRDGLETASKLGRVDPEDHEIVLRQVERATNNTLIQAAETVEVALRASDGAEYQRWLEKSFAKLRASDTTVLDALRALPGLFATTNYDSILTDALGQEPIPWNKHPEFQNVARGERPGVLHFHGHWKTPDSVVFGGHSYSRLSHHQAYEAFLRALTVLRTCVFIGCGPGGLSDPDLGPHFRWFHEAIRVSQVRFYHLVCASELSAGSGRPSKLGERVLEISYGAEHRDLAGFLSDLASSVGSTPRDVSPAAEMSPAPAGRAMIPPEPEVFVGREKQLDELIGQVLRKEKKVCIVHGVPGLGKSALTLRLLHHPRIVECFGERRFFLSGGVAETPGALIDLAAEALGVGDSRPRREAVRAHLAEHGGLLVIDNFETPWDRSRLDVEKLVAEWRCPGKVAIVLSLRGGDLPRQFELRTFDPPPLTPTEATALFHRISDDRFKGNEKVEQKVEQLLEAMAGLPLAVSLCAHVARICNDVEFVHERWVNEGTRVLWLEEDRESSLDFSLRLSWDNPRLMPETKRFLALLARLPAGVAKADIRSVLGRDAGPHIQQALSFGLCLPERGRVQLLAPIRRFILEEKEVAETHGPWEATSTFYLTLAAELKGAAGSADGPNATQRLRPELPNIIAATRDKATLKRSAPMIVDAWCAIGELARFAGWNVRSELEEVAGRFSKTIDPHGRARIDLVRADGELSRSRLSAAAELYLETLPLFKQVRSDLGYANCIRGLGSIALAHSEYTEAEARFEEALPYFNRENNVLGIAGCIRGLGNIALARGDYDGARAHLLKALPLFREEGRVQGEANCIRGLGDSALGLKKYSEAKEMYDNAHALYRKVGDVQGEAVCIRGQGEIFLEGSTLSEARPQFEMALPLFRQVGDVQGEANCIRGLGDIAFARGDRREARARFEEALQLFVSVAEPYSIGRIHLRLAWLAEVGSTERTSHSKAAREAWKSIDRPDLVAELDAEFGVPEDPVGEGQVKAEG